MQTEPMSRWLRQALEAATHAACFMLALGMFLAYGEIQDHGFVPFRYYLIWSACVLVLSLSVIFSIKSKWKTISTLLSITLLIFFGFVAGTGFFTVIFTLMGDDTNHTLLQGLMALSLGGFMFWKILLLLSSNKLK